MMCIRELAQNRTQGNHVSSNWWFDMKDSEMKTTPKPHSDSGFWGCAFNWQIYRHELLISKWNLRTFQEEKIKTRTGSGWRKHRRHINYSSKDCSPTVQLMKESRGVVCVCASGPQGQALWMFQRSVSSSLLSLFQGDWTQRAKQQLHAAATLLHQTDRQRDVCELKSVYVSVWDQIHTKSLCLTN